MDISVKLCVSSPLREMFDQSQLDQAHVGQFSLPRRNMR